MARRRGHNEGSIFARRNNDGVVTGYQVQVVLPTGKRKTLGTVKTLREAKQLAQRGQVDITTGRWSDTSRQSVAHYLNGWLEMKQSNIRYGTVVSYRQCILLASAHIGHVNLAALTPAHVQHCYAELLGEGRGVRSVGLTHAVLHAALRRAVQLDLIPRNPTDSVTPPKAARYERPALSIEQLDHLIRSVSDMQLRALVLLLATSGARIGEALGIRWADTNSMLGRL